MTVCRVVNINIIAVRYLEMERENVSSSSSLAVNSSRTLWPAIGDADLLPDDLSRGLKLTFIVAYTTIILMALGGNGLMVAAVIADRRLRTVTNTFMMSLAVSDVLIATVNMPLQLWYYHVTVPRPVCSRRTSTQSSCGTT